MPPEASAHPDWLRPDWDAPAAVGALMSTRAGGVSVAPFDSLNLRPSGLPGDAVDEPAAVTENQRRFAAAMGVPPVWLDQVHGAEVVRLQADLHAVQPGALPRADASITTEPGLGCAVLVADCLPVLFCDRRARGVGAAHAGWRGLAGGVLENTIAALCHATGAEPGELQAWLGASIGPRQFEVGADVLDAFGGPSARFVARTRADGSARWLADLPGLARDRLAGAGVTQVAGGWWCTVEAPSRFFSFRRERATGRMAAAVWLRG